MDLRGPQLLSSAELAKVARALGGKGLKLLVVAGLRSWDMYPGGNALELAEVEGGTWDAEWEVWRRGLNGEGEVNWWKMFMGAVRPGGRLVFVDKQDGGELSLLQPDAHHRNLLGL